MEIADDATVYRRQRRLSRSDSVSSEGSGRSIRSSATAGTTGDHARRILRMRQSALLRKQVSLRGVLPVDVWSVEVAARRALAEGHYDEAVEKAELCIGTISKNVDADHPRLLYSFVLLGQAHGRAGRLEAGEAALCKAKQLITKYNTELNRAELADVAVTGLTELCDLYKRAGNMGAALDEARAALKLAYDLGTDSGTACHHLGALLLELSRLEDASSALSRALEQREKALGKLDAHTAESAMLLAETYIQLGRWADALSLLMQFEAAVEMQDDDVALSDLVLNCGICLQEMERYEEAFVFYQRALALREGALGEEHSTTAACYNAMGRLLCCQGKLDDAVVMLDKALAVRLAAVGETHPLTAECHMLLGEAHSKLGEQRAAVSSFCAARAIAVSSFGETHPLTLSAELHVANALFSLGRLKHALLLYESLLRRAAALRGAVRLNLSAIHNNIANVFRQQGREELALEHYQLALAGMIKTHGSAYIGNATLHNNIGSIHLAAGQYGKAWAQFVAAKAIRERQFGALHADTATCYHNMGMWYLRQLEYSDALDMFHKEERTLVHLFGRDDSRCRDVGRIIAQLLRRRRTASARSSPTMASPSVVGGEWV
eukprot:PLAT5005.2.p1 GENE.PLAT5005.2~~PLAT5005.2.p1  ORF type:complete len:609 (-),score=220.26 PLAT5005.2:629-2455(-)